jgi:hypothetical protein
MSIDFNPQLTHLSCTIQENISSYLEACKKLGMTENHLFSTVDLMENKGNFFAVLHSLHYVKRHADQFKTAAATTTSTSSPSPSSVDASAAKPPLQSSLTSSSSSPSSSPIPAASIKGSPAAKKVRARMNDVAIAHETQRESNH